MNTRPNTRNTYFSSYVFLLTHQLRTIDESLTLKKSHFKCFLSHVTFSFILFSLMPFFPSEDQEIPIRSHSELYLRFECRQRVLEPGINAYDIVLIQRRESPRALSVVTIGKFARLKTCTVCRSDSPPFTISTTGASPAPSATYASQ